MSEQEEKDALRRAMKISVTEGVFAQIFSSLAGPGSIFLTKFAILFNATPFHFGVLAAAGQLSQIFQPLGVALTRRLSTRKGVVLKLLYVGRFAPLLFAPLPFLFDSLAAVWIFLALFFASTSLLAVAGNVWIAWISDLVPLKIRGRFFSSRSLYLMVAGLLTGYALGFFLDLFDPQSPWILRTRAALPDGGAFFRADNLKTGFVVLFVLSAAAGLVSTWLLRRQPEKTKEVETESLGRIFSAPLKDPNFRRLLFYGTWWMLVIGIGSPFWGPFMIQKLRMTITEIQIYGTISVISSLLVLKPWGRIIDRFGNKTAMRMAIALGGLNAMIWVFPTAKTFWIVYIEAATSGVMWSGAGIVATNFVLSIAPKGKAQIYSGVFGAFSGVAMMATMLVSSALLPPPVEWLGLHLEPEQVLFALTAVGRWTTQIPLTFIREDRARPVGEALHYIITHLKLRFVHSLIFLTERGKKNGLGDP